MQDKTLNTKFQTFLDRHTQLSNQLMENPSLYQELGKEYAFLEELVILIKKYFANEKALEDLQLWLKNEPEMQSDIRAEIENTKKELEQDLENVKTYLLKTKESDDDGNAIIEIRPGTGGVESCLFASDLLKMYIRFASDKGWKIEEHNISIGEQDGIKEACIAVKGAGAYRTLQYESGVHRVQRVPVTEASGRIHTSAATVAVLPEEKAIDINLDERDLEIDVYRAGGKGGQSVNTTDSAVRITHLPTGIVVAMQDERSQLQNKQKAMRILKMRVYQKMKDEEDAARAKDRKEQVGSGDRSERIRTYNFPQNRITDHRINKSWYNMDAMLAGEILDELSEDLILHYKEDVI